MKRKHRHGEIVCRCMAYPFPHRQLGGQCNGAAFVGRYFEAQIYGACRDCHLREQSDDGSEIECQALQGREELTRCPGLDEHIRFEGIKLYCVNRPPERLQRVSGSRHWPGGR